MSDVRLASTVGAVANLRDIRMLNLSAVMHSLPGEGLNADVEYTFDWTRTGEVLACELECRVRISSRMEEGSESSSASEDADVFSATVRYGAVFLLAEDRDFTDEALEAFTNINARLVLNPYIRETVQGITMRAGLPPLVLETSHVPLMPDPVDGQSEPAETLA